MDFRAGDLIYYDLGQNGLLEVTHVESGFIWVKYLDSSLGDRRWCIAPAQAEHYRHSLKIFEVGDRLRHKSSLNEYVITGITEDGIEIDGLSPLGPKGQFFSKHREYDRWERLLDLPKEPLPRKKLGRQIL